MFTFLLLVAASYNVAYGMECSIGESKNIVEKLVKTCPVPFFGKESAKYCCPDGNDSFKCCEIDEFIKEWTFFVLPFVVLVLVLSFVISCICCFCCPFCCVYKRRH